MRLQTSFWEGFIILILKLTLLIFLDENSVIERG